MMRATLALVLSLGLHGCHERKATPPPREEIACSAMGCPSGLMLDLDSPLSEEELLGATLRYCRGDYCEAATFKKPASGALQGMSLRTPAGKPGATVRVRSRAEGKPWLSFGHLRAGGLNAGDRYHVTLTDANGKVQIELDHTVSAYEPVYVNGPKCGVTCNQAVLDLRVAPH
jgi:hypothetical protein